MVLSFNQYMGYLYGIGAAILLVIAIAYYLIIWRHQNLFEIIIDLTLKIKTHDLTKEEEKKKTDSPTTTLTKGQAFESVQPPTAIQTLAAATRSLAVETRMPTEAALPTAKKYLDLYGKNIHPDSFRNRCFLAIIIVVLVFTATIAFYQQIFLANTTIYPGDPCPSNFIQMDCYFGSEQTYFNCTQGQQTDPKFVNGSAMCFRWLFHDISVNDVFTTFGACAGLLNAFFAMTQALLYYLIHCSAKILVNDHDDKNKTSKPTQPQTEKPASVSPSAEEQGTESGKPKHVHKHTIFSIINTVLLCLLMLIAIGAVIVFSVFKISTTVLTYVILATMVFMACIAVVWMREIDAHEHDLNIKNHEESPVEVADAGRTIYGFLKCGK